jgi:hypothetical protein
MTRTRLLTALAIAAALLIASLMALDAGPFASNPSTPGATPSKDPGPVMATVDGRPVYLSEMRSRVEGLQTVHGDFAEVFGEDWPETLLQNLVDDKIVEQQAAALGITVSDEEIRAHVDELRSRFPTDQAFQDWLEAGRMDEGELADRITLQTLASELYLQVTGDVSVSGAAVHRYFKGHLDDYPGADGEGAPFTAVREQIRDDLLKVERDRAYGEWLDTERGLVEVVVVLPDWWKEFA